MSNQENKPNLEQDYLEENYQGVGGFVLEIIKIVILAFLIIVPIRVFLFQPFFVQGASMEPNFQDKQYLIINELGYKKTVFNIDGKNIFTVKPFRKINRGEVIVFRYPIDTEKFFIKRVVGLPGEKIEVKENKVTIYNEENPDGLVLDESPYLSPGIVTAGDLVTKLDADEFFVMGDNRRYSSDSRTWGPVKDKYVMGIVLLRAWPLDKVDLY